MESFVFFVQLEPDIDHVTPIAYRLNLELPGSVILICTNPLFDIASDYRLQFLQKSGVQVIYLCELGSFTHSSFIFARALRFLPKFFLGMFPHRVWVYVYQHLGSASESSLVRFFKLRRTKAVTVDEGLPPRFLEPILAACRNLKIKTVRLTTSNHVLKQKTSAEMYATVSLTDYQLRPHLITPIGPLSRSGTDEKVLGCMRYCSGWEGINAKLIEAIPEAALLPKPKGKLKVLVFERSTKGFLSDHSTVKRIRDLGFCEVIFRSRPRTLRPHKLYADTFDALPSSLLIQWADVVVCSISSIVLDVLHYKKAFLYAKYLAPNEVGVFEDFGACWRMDTEDQLIESVRDIASANVVAPYGQASVDSYFTQAVYLGDPSYDVLGGYSRFYRSLPSP